jgi:hypothetical protein
VPGRDDAFCAFTTWLQRLEKSLSVIMLRPKAIDPDSAFDGDFDFVADPAALPRIIAAARDAATECRTAIEVDQRRPYKTTLRFLTLDVNVSIVAEVWPHAELRADGAVSAVPWKAIDRMRDADGNAPSSLLALLYLGHLQHKRKDLRSPEVRSRLALLDTQLGEQDPPTDEDVRDVVTRLIEDPDALPAAAGDAVTALRRRGIRIERLPRLTPRRIRDAVNRRLPGRGGLHLVPVVGPDGVGKTALGDAIQNAPGMADAHIERFVFKKVFRDAVPVRLLLRWSLRRDRRSGGKTARNLLEERHPHVVLLSAILRWPRLWAGRAVRVRRSGRSELVLIDRWFWDYLLRVRASGVAPRPVAAQRVYRRLIPRTERVVILTCPTEVIHQRKQELSAQGISALYEQYMEHLTATRVPRTLILSTELPLDSEHAELIQFLRNA